MKKQLITIFFILFVQINFAQTYRSQVLSKDIQTLKVDASNNWLRVPIIDLKSNDFIQISFDYLSDDSQRLMYRIVHCNADWTPSSLSEIEYIDGFNNNIIDDYSLSMNTTVEYTNFKLQIPNKDVRLKVSGNYVVLVYGEDKPNKILLTACFSLVIPAVSITAQMTSNTDIDSNKEHQQLAFTMNYSGLRSIDPINDFKIYVQQNNRLDNEKRLPKANYISQNKLVFDHNRDLIFEAGNEYRRFESVSSRYNGLNIESTQFNRPFYDTYIIPDVLRSDRSYSYDQDQNGRFLIRNAEINNQDQEQDTGADYFTTHFCLQSDEPILGNVYLDGDFTNNTFSADNLMHYDPIKRCYSLSLRLKQGAYNYQYLTETEKGHYSPAPIEGNYFETENEYRILIYYRPIGQRYDSLVGSFLIKK